MNYEDENLNIALPVFAIHGNHDDPTREVTPFRPCHFLGSGGRSAFGSRHSQQYSSRELFRQNRKVRVSPPVQCSVEDIQIKPILLQKGATKLAIYGMGYVPDERLSRMFEQHQVTFFQPPDDDSWFHLFIIHQNCDSGRSVRSMRLDLLPRFLQLVIWGHEHECCIDPSWNDEGVSASQ